MTCVVYVPRITKLSTVCRHVEPTRELAVQVHKQLNAMLGKQTRIKSALLIGGESMPKQLQQMRMPWMHSVYIYADQW